MDRDEAKEIFYAADGSELEDDLLDIIFNEIEKEIKQLKNENARLKKQLANNHHMECNCSFCKPNYKTQLDEDLEDYSKMVKCGINAN